MNKRKSLLRKQNMVKTTEIRKHTFQSVCDLSDLMLSSEEALLNISRKLDISAVLVSATFSLYPEQTKHTIKKIKKTKLTN